MWLPQCQWTRPEDYGQIFYIDLSEGIQMEAVWKHNVWIYHFSCSMHYEINVCILKSMFCWLWNNKMRVISHNQNLVYTYMNISIPVYLMNNTRYTCTNSALIAGILIKYFNVYFRERDHEFNSQSHPTLAFNGKYNWEESLRENHNVMKQCCENEQKWVCELTEECHISPISIH